MAFSVQSGGQVARQQTSSHPKCNHCGRPGHDITKCYKLHGFPEGWVPQTSGRGSITPQVAGRGRGRGSSGVANAVQHTYVSPSISITDQEKAAFGNTLTSD